MKKKLLYLVYSLLFFLPARLLAQHVVISQVYGGGGNSGATYKNDFIELYNPTNANVDISTWSVQYMAVGGSGVTQASNMTSFTAGTVIKAHSYFLIQEGAGMGGTTDLANPDINNGAIAMGSTGGKVALVSNQNMLGSGAATGSGIVDFVGWGAATTYEGSGPASATTNPTSVARKLDPQGGSGYDTDDNANDFTLQTTITPHNSSITITVASPTLTPSSTSLDFGTTQTVGTTSASQNFTIGNSGLTAGATVSLSGSSYLISKDNTTFAATALTYSTTELGAAATSKVYVQFKPTATGAATGQITITSTGATDAKVNLTGTGAAPANPATLTVAGTPATPLTFTNQVINTTSAAQFFNFSATNLSANVTATATGPYLVSKDGFAFSSVVSYTSAEVTAATKVYVQFTPTAVGAATGTVKLETATATAQTVNLSGTGVAAPVSTAANHVVISQMYGAGGTGSATYRWDFLELYNPTNNDIDLNGWSIQYQAAATSGTAYSGIQPINATTTITAAAPAGNTIIKAHGYFLIQEAGATTNGVDLPVAADLVSSLLNFSGTTGKIALVNTVTPIIGTPPAPPIPPAASNAAVIDFLGFGTTPNYGEGWSSGAAISSYAAGAPSITTSLIRKASVTATAASMASGGADYLTGNGWDSDNNFNDFIVIPAGSLPLHNSASAIQPAFQPAYTATPNTLTFSQNVNTTSATQFFTITGLGTLPVTSVGTTAPYLLSKDGTTGFSTTLSFTAAEMLTNPKVYVQFTPPTVATYTAVVNITGVGATQTSVALNGTGSALPVPSLTANPNTLTFANAIVGVAAPVLSYTLSGTNISTGTTVTTSGAYKVSKDGTTFSASISFTAAEVNASPSPKVYVQFIPTAVGANPGTVTQTSVAAGGTANTTVTLSGNGANAAPTMTAITDQTVCYTATPQIIAINAISPVETGQTVVVSATNDNPGMFSQFGVLPLTATTAQINYTLAPGASGTANVTLKLKDNGGVANNGVDTLLTKFKITVNALAVVTITSDVAGNLVEKGSTATLTASGGVSYVWTANATIISSLTDASIQVRPSVATTYTVTATNASGCTTVQNIAIGVRAATKLETSNVITPNGDGINDVWVIRNIDLYPTNNVKVYDKAGKMVYSKTGYNNDWNGYYNGSPLTQGSYVYVVDLGAGQTYRGVLSIVRDK